MVVLLIFRVKSSFSVLNQQWCLFLKKKRLPTSVLSTLMVVVSSILRASFCNGGAKGGGKFLVTIRVSSSLDFYFTLHGQFLSGYLELVLGFDEFVSPGLSFLTACNCKDFFDLLGHLCPVD